MTHNGKEDDSSRKAVTEIWVGALTRSHALPEVREHGFFR
jgi:hypothetical protein